MYMYIYTYTSRPQSTNNIICTHENIHRYTIQYIIFYQKPKSLVVWIGET